MVLNLLVGVASSSSLVGALDLWVALAFGLVFD